MDLNIIKRDIQSFADNEADVIIEKNGEVVFTRGGEDIEFKLIENRETGQLLVKYQGSQITYNKFISKEIAKLDVFANRLIEKRKTIEPYIDGPATLRTPWSRKEGSVLELLDEECSEFLISGTKISFITADAGHGKTALLKQYQNEQAKKYLKGESDFLFWHVDLQGRDLVRLAEAIMYDLGELRITGLYFSSIITLIKNRHIVLAIDGFDELAAEIGGDSALGALSSLVSQMDQSGTLIAASRRTFFDTQDYLKRTNFLQGKISPECVFDELKVKDWNCDEAKEYLSYYFDSPNDIYDKILIELHNNSNHPILSRPFLLTKIVQGLEASKMEPSEFMGGIENTNEGVASVVESFTKREVTKWKEWDKVTGKPYLEYQQHIKILSTVAREMWEGQKESITVEELEFYTTILIDEWKINEKTKPVIIRMLKSHALLIPPSDGDNHLRKFDHEEFKNYFIARSLSNLINQALEGLMLKNLKRFMYVGQLPDSVAKYLVKYISKTYNVDDILRLFSELLKNEWKPTYLQSNLGTIIPFILDGSKTDTELFFDGKVNYSSLIFEGKSISNIKLQNGNFINISLNETKLKDVTFKNCSFNEIRIESGSTNCFNNVKIIDSEISTILILKDGENIDAAYSPDRILELLELVGISVVEHDEKIESQLKKASDFKKYVIKFLSKFNRAIHQYEKSLETQNVFGSSTNLILNDIIPFLDSHNIIELAESKSTKQVGGKAWKLACELSELLEADRESNGSEFSQFWSEVNKK